MYWLSFCETTIRLYFVFFYLPHPKIRKAKCKRGKRGIFLFAHISLLLLWLWSLSKEVRAALLFLSKKIKLFLFLIMEGWLLVNSEVYQTQTAIQNLNEIESHIHFKPVGGTWRRRHPWPGTSGNHNYTNNEVTGLCEIIYEIQAHGGGRCVKN